MNKKGFAISVILYIIVFFIITIFYVLLGIVKARYNTNSNLKDSVVDKLNSASYIHDKFEDDH